MKQLTKCGICLQPEAIWDQLALSEPTFNDTVDIGNYIEYRDKMSLVKCHKCKQKGHITPNCTIQRSDQWKTQSKPDQSSKLVVVAAAANEDTSVRPSIGNLEALLRQMISSSSTSTALPTIPGSPNELSNDQTSMAPILEDVSSTDIAPGTNEIENPPVTSSSSHLTWVKNPPTYLQDYHCFSALTSLHKAQSYKEASLDPLWQQAMKKELQALEKTGTWDLVDLLTDKTFVGCKWEYGIDFEETFAPIARLTIVRSLLAITAVHKWKLFQMDVKNAFLNGDLEDEVYMKPPPRLTPPSNKVCRLRRALYGLKQPPQAWFAKFSCTVSEFGFTSSPHDTALFVSKSTQGMVLLLIYVDDMIITRDDASKIDELKQFLSHRFEMKDLGSLSYFLGLEVTSLHDVYGCPRSTHYAAVLRIIRYVKGIIFHGLHFSAHSSLVLRAYSNADWAGDLTD
ncbi:hypothetical protein SLEP1_g58720 [Rubroshorea leprosula]|uniref:Reverse transcriptase Ty1/copia-type domain-containing protein n=1 Tax=Rubroshorea leprosula TaxID=152421 RepID=A0AAV5MRF0_9ROSI|nr:hypothetical protein SLEP1_g58720 [Rubroshorea leprosula]